MFFLTGSVWEYRAFGFWYPHISIALSLVIILCISQAQISLPRTYHALPQPFACAHFVLFLLNTSFIELSSFLRFKAWSQSEKDPRPSSFGGKWGLCFNHLAWPLGILLGPRGTEGNELVLKKSLEEKYMPKISPWSVTSPTQLCPHHQDKWSSLYMPKPQTTLCRAGLSISQPVSLSIHLAIHLLGNCVPITETRPANSHLGGEDHSRGIYTQVAEVLFLGFPCSSAGKESACNAGDPSSNCCQSSAWVVYCGRWVDFAGRPLSWVTNLFWFA